MMDLLAKKESLSRLYDEYHALLTLAQREVFEDYYFADLSLQEIAENRHVSRNAIFDSLKKTAEKLAEYEEKLHLALRKSRIIALLDSSIDPALAQAIRKIMEE